MNMTPVAFGGEGSDLRWQQRLKAWRIEEID
jgi:hypothetical protein